MTPTSATLLQRLRDPRDGDAWKRLLHLYTPLIRGWLKRHLPQSADVEDLAQQVFAVVVEKLPAFDHNGRTGAFRAWLRGISVNRLRMFYRSRPEAGPDQEPILEQLEDPHSDLSRRWDREHDAHVVRQMLQLIEPEFKSATWRAFCLLVLDDQEPEAVAAKVGLSVNAVFIAKSRVLRRLREELNGLVL
jgi:RNA polymerase sigma-70 factor (ECF subfamily)